MSTPLDRLKDAVARLDIGSARPSDLAKALAVIEAATNVDSYMLDCCPKDVFQALTDSLATLTQEEGSWE